MNSLTLYAYHYFGRDAQYMDKKLAPLLKKGGMIALAFPGLKEELGQEVPKEMLLSWTAEDIATWHPVHGGRRCLGNQMKSQFKPSVKWKALMSAGRIGFPVKMSMPLLIAMR